MNKRRERRIKRRLTCEIRAGEKSWKGVVLDVSSGGLFVQTGANAPVNSQVEVLFPERGERPAFVVRARVAWRRQVPQRLHSVTSRGMGLEVIRPPPAFQDLVFGETATGISGALGDGQTKPEPRPELPQFSVRLGQVGGPRSRTLVVHAEDEEAAKRVATRRIGPEWQILQVKPK